MITSPSCLESQTQTIEIDYNGENTEALE